jgi:Flp pilus assembly protein TadG
MRSNLSSEQGAIAIQVALAMVAFIAFNVFVVDYGVMWVGRGQAQNAADAGALAGATALAFDDFDDRSDTGPAKTAAHQLAIENGVWGDAPANDIATDVYFPTTPSVCADNSCIRVDVYRDQDHGNALPAIFGLAAGVPGSGVRAMAIALDGDRIQVSTNVHDPIAVPLAAVVAATRRLGEPLGVRPVAAEIVGLVPAAALAGWPDELPIVGGEGAIHTIESRLDAIDRS